MVRLILFDLDDTLVVEEAAAAAAFEATAAAAAAHHDLDAGALAAGARVAARDLWYASAVHAYCLRVGISSWEGLWCRFGGDGAEQRWLRTWAPAYRRETWRAALAAQGVEDDGLAERLGERFGAERRRRHAAFPDAGAVLAQLHGACALGVVTNGASCLQREKLAASGLERWLDFAVVSADVGAGKPDPALFEHALARAGVGADDALVVGDSFARDVEGATRAGLRAVWLNRTARQRPGSRTGVAVAEIASLSELPALLR